MKRIIIANWKMNPASAAEAVALAEETERAAAVYSRGVEIVVAPPAPFLIPVAATLKKARLASQNVFWESAGAYTGEVSSTQLKNIGVSHVIVGHSERKKNLGETDDMIAKKVSAVLHTGLTAVLCVGEEYRTGAEIPAIVGERIKNALSGVRKKELKNVIICYEPVWAISTTAGARPAMPDDAFRASVLIRKMISGLFGREAGEGARIIYGGSVNAKNIAGFLGEGRMDGALVGSASLDAQEFSAIIQTAH